MRNYLKETCGLPVLMTGRIKITAGYDKRFS